MEIRILFETNEMAGTRIDENGTKPNEEEVEAVLKLKPSNDTKQLKPFPGAIMELGR